ncbi:MAG: thymidine phosphorylase [Alphaproteobacteria bacterium]|nr:thymidine phosphorylase [Alphaproteobacteria bacterium]MBL7098448.1 thymidine phosphorylase [Alphaproteobacteria bacterium]
MLPQELIRKKRDGHALNDDEIHLVVDGITHGTFTESQVSAFAMAVFFRGMNAAERVAFTRAMTHSGRVLSWEEHAVGGPVLDKHSTGGVGDKVSIMLAPIVAACGGVVPMISGRGLGHTGGTLDKMGCIPGYVVNPDIETFQRVTREVGCAIIGQTADLAPADRRLYAVRDVTATVESIPLISASILSKKLAAGLTGLVMDVKTGSGAFMADPAQARELAETLVSIGKGAELPITALITDMDSVLGTTAGHTLEMIETLDYLTGKGSRDTRLHEVVIALAAEMLLLGGLVPNPEEGRDEAQQALDSGRAAEAFSRMVSALGGPNDFVEKSGRYLKPAPVVKDVIARRTGYLQRYNTRDVGVQLIDLGGGRRKTTDVLNLEVGFTDIVHCGTKVTKGDVIAKVHAADEAAAGASVAVLSRILHIDDPEPRTRPVISERITASA